MSGYDKNFRLVRKNTSKHYIILFVFDARKKKNRFKKIIANKIAKLKLV